MDKEKKHSVHGSPRSLQAVLSNGYQLYGKNFWRLLRSSWIQAVIYALLVGVSMTYFFSWLLPRLMLHGSFGLELTYWCITLLLFLASAALFACAGGVAPLQEHALTGNISKPRRWWGRWPWRLAWRSFVVLPRMLWKTIRRRQLGTLIAVSLAMLLVVIVATIVLQLPAVILAVANVEAQAGLADGDAVDVPRNLWLINLGTFSACGLLQAYIHLSTLFPLYYVWRLANVER